MTEQTKISDELQALQDFILKHCAEADSIDTDEKGNLAFHAGPDPIKKLTAKQVKEYHVLANAIDDTSAKEYNQDELIKESEIDELQKKMYESVEDTVNVEPPKPVTPIKSKYETFNPQAVEITSTNLDSNLPTLPATRYRG